MADEGRGDRVRPAVELRVEVSGKAGMGSITARPPRRRFWNWLLRRPRYALPAAR
ncbi:MAG TPA: hypothetical protein VGM53_26720 [Streptosporangiaceae bacterium]|jgi:hypothetical protein